MIDVGDNFGNKGVCLICHIGENNQKHLLECKDLNLDIDISYKYENTFEEDSDNVVDILRVFYKAYQKREVIIEQRNN